MKKIDVRVVTIESMNVISFLGYGENPEMIAINSFRQWIHEQNVSIKNASTKIFGFNNPCPSIGSKNYGYEIWLSIPQDMDVPKEKKIILFPGGLYAQTPINVTTGEEIPLYWEALNHWCENSDYTLGCHQWLVEFTLEPRFPFAIYLPIKKE